MMRAFFLIGMFVVCTGQTSLAIGDDSQRDPSTLQMTDVFELEYATDPQVSPDGEWVVYVRRFMDIMTDRSKGNLWMVRSDGTGSRPLTSGDRNDGSPIWSPDGRKIYFVSNESGTAQIHAMWLDNGQSAVVSRLTSSPSGLQLSPDGTTLAFSMFVPHKATPIVALSGRPEGAEWAAPATEITRVRYRADGQGFLPDGYRQLFVLPVDGGTPKQLTEGEFNHGSDFCWSPDSESIVLSANRHEESDFRPLDSNLFEIDVTTRDMIQLTARNGPESSPTISPDGSKIAFVGFEDQLLGYQIRRLWIANRDGTDPQTVNPELDRSVSSPTWIDDGNRLVFQYDDHGETLIAMTSLNGEIELVADSVGGTSIGRPYPGGSYSSTRTGSLAYTLCGPNHPADVAFYDAETGTGRRLTSLNDDLFSDRKLGDMSTLEVESSYDGNLIQAWVVTPPDFDSTKKYPLLLEIHGGPFQNYGPRFAMEVQLYAAAGYVVVYANPRGSTSYGFEFGNLIHHRYPGEDYDDLMSVVDAVIETGVIDEDRLFVTGGSGGGVLTAWIVGNTDRFRAAVVAKPVINWYSFALTADAYDVFYKYWFPGPPWEHQDEYMRRSPLSLVGNVTTPTMLLTGEEDFRTPMSETEQYYQALKLRGIDTMMVRIPGASHGITARPSNLMAKVAYVLKWFEMHDQAMSD